MILVMCLRADISEKNIMRITHKLKQKTQLIHKTYNSAGVELITKQK